MLCFAKQQQIVPRMTNGSIAKICSSKKSFCLTFPRNPLSYHPFQVRGRTR